MAQANNQQKPVEQGYTLECWHGRLLNEAIKEYHPEIKTIETIGHLWFCVRRFKKEFKGDHTKLTAIELLSYQHPDCPHCHRENQQWQKHITVDFKKTKFSKETIRNWITGELKRGARTFLLNSEAIPKKKGIEIVNTRMMENYKKDEENKIPSPDHNPFEPKFYNPDQFTEQEDLP